MGGRNYAELLGPQEDFGGRGGGLMRASNADRSKDTSSDTVLNLGIDDNCLAEECRRHRIRRRAIKLLRRLGLDQSAIPQDDELVGRRAAFDQPAPASSD